MVIANAISKVAGGNQPLSKADANRAARSNAKNTNGNNSTSQENTNNAAQSTTSGPDAGTAAGQAVGRLGNALNNGGINAFSMPGMAPPAGNANQMAQMMGAGGTSGSGSVPAPATGGGGSAKPRNRGGGGGSGGGGGGCGPGGCPNTNDGGGSGGGGSGGGGVGGPGGSNTNPGVNPGKPVVGADRTFENNGQKLTLPGAGNKVADVDGNATKEQLLASGTKGLPTLAIFSGKEANGTYWCGPCKNQKSKVDGLPSQLDGKVNVAEVAASNKGSSLSNEMKIGSFPSYVLFDAQGKEISRGSFVDENTVSKALAAGNTNDAALKEAAIKDAEAKKSEDPKSQTDETKPEAKPEEPKAEAKKEETKADSKATDTKTEEKKSENNTTPPTANSNSQTPPTTNNTPKSNQTFNFCVGETTCLNSLSTELNKYQDSVEKLLGAMKAQNGIEQIDPKFSKKYGDFYSQLKEINTIAEPAIQDRDKFEKLIKEQLEKH